MVDLILGNRVLDAGLAALDAEATHIYVCHTQPGTYAEATSTFALGSKNFGAGGVFASPVTATPGRSVASVAVPDGVITTTGTVAYWAVVDNVTSRLLATGALTGGGAVTVGQNFTLGSFTIQLPGEVVTVTPPSGVQAWDPANKSANITLSGSPALVATGGVSSTEGVRGLIGLSSGKIYWEVVITTFPGGTNLGIGFCDSTFVMGGGGSGTCIFSFSSDTSYYRSAGVAQPGNAGGSPYTAGVIVGIALDITNRLFWMTRDGSAWNGGGPDPSTATGGVAVDNITVGGFDGGVAMNLPLYPLLDIRGSGIVMTGVFQTPYNYTKPTGYTDWV